MQKFLIIVDMQNDFIEGSLGTEEARRIVPCAAEKIRNFDGNIFVTLDTHSEDYFSTREGRKLPVSHCIRNTDGWMLSGEIEKALDNKKFDAVEKNTFGSTELPALIREKAGDDDISIEIIGLCTDICVVSNAIILKAAFPESEIAVDADCCAGVTPELHIAALKTMESCQIDIKGRWKDV